jgi:hypothetical protein
VARHIFQACPVWIYTQSNITQAYNNDIFGKFSVRGNFSWVETGLKRAFRFSLTFCNILFLGFNVSSQIISSFLFLSYANFPSYGMRYVMKLQNEIYVILKVTEHLWVLILPKIFLLVSVKALDYSSTIWPSLDEKCWKLAALFNKIHFACNKKNIENVIFKYNFLPKNFTAITDF